jgi:diguanylate cyclase (GGDEF)-like protein
LDETEEATDLAARIQQRGYDAITASGDAGAAAVAAENPDLVLINADRAGSLAMTRALKSERATRSIPIMLSTSERLADHHGPGFDAGADDVVEFPISDAGLFGRVRSLVRLNNLYRELMRRRDTMERFAIDLPPKNLDTVELAGARVLVLGTAATDEMVTPLGGDFGVTRTTRPHEALDRLGEDSYDAILVFAGPGEGEAMLTFCADVRNNASLFNLPLLLIVADPALQDADEAYRRRVSDVLFEPVRPEELRQRTLAWTRQQRYRKNLLQASRNPAHIYTLDGLTTLFSRGFMLDYLSSLIEDCEKFDKSFSVSFFEIRGMAEINAENGYSSGDHLIRQIGQLIGQLVRSEDLAARYRGKEICIVLPETPGEVARMVMGRIASVVQRTDFLVMGCMKVLNADLAFGVAEFRRGDTAIELIQRSMEASR